MAEMLGYTVDEMFSFSVLSLGTTGGVIAAAATTRDGNATHGYVFSSMVSPVEPGTYAALPLKSPVSYLDSNGSIALFSSENGTISLVDMSVATTRS